MKQYKISIIVPVYNAEKYLVKCMDTLVGQSYQNLEIVLVNDGSADNSLALCEEYGRADSRVKVINKKNGGLISAWKRGVEESTGEYLAFVDSDDWVDLNMIKEMAEHLTGSGKEIVASDYVIEKENGERQYVWQQLAPGEYTGEVLKTKAVPNILGNESRYICISRCMKLISRKLIEDNCKYSDPVIAVSEDLTIMLPTLIDCERLVIMNRKAYYHYYYVTTSMVHKYDQGLYENMQRLRKVILNIIQDKFPVSQQQEMIKKADQEYVFLLLLVLKNEARGNQAGYRKNIIRICKEKEIREIVKCTDVEVKQMANRLLYFVLCHPNCLSVRVLRMAMIVYYRK